MAFNSDAYHSNRNRRSAWQHLAKAREIKARVEAGEAYDWEAPRIATEVSLARSSMHIHLSWRRIAAIKAGDY